MDVPPLERGAPSAERKMQTDRGDLALCPLRSALSSVVVCVKRNRAVPLRVDAKVLERGLTAVLRDELFVVEIGNAGDAVERCDELFGTKSAPEERVREENVVTDHAERAERDFRVEAQQLLHALERRIDRKSTRLNSSHIPLS